MIVFVGWANVQASVAASTAMLSNNWPDPLFQEIYQPDLALRTDIGASPTAKAKAPACDICNGMKFYHLRFLDGRASAPAWSEFRIDPSKRLYLLVPRILRPMGDAGVARRVGS